MTRDTGKPIPPDEWEVIVRNVPIVSVDLLALTDSGIVLGKRTNEPAKGEYFVPGGTVLKHESLADAVHRIAQEELGTDVQIEYRLGVFEHFYDTAELPEVDGKHYVAIAYVVTPLGEELVPDEQHADLATFADPDCQLDLHPYILEYLDDLDDRNEFD